ncbi:hypothetical protein BaOVIS_010320 [Babesia ovis]|uniref:Uncharacterized protein n=1 Tax=Babesia ovis TaxID=5869 RepID=A0A9W5TBD9_BABOV|nr:hypothetical protein BaOVIS_010320 [Babesia ovis]
MRDMLKSHTHFAVDKVVVEIIRRELQHHKDIVKLIWWASTLQISAIVAKSRPTRPWLSDKRLYASIIKLDLGGAVDLVENGSLSLQDKSTITKGSTVLLYAQCSILLNDVRAACKKSVDSTPVERKSVTLPRSKTGARHVTTAAVESASLWKSHGGAFSFTDKKFRLEGIDNRMNTPNAHDGFEYNKIIMGVGIYSQYEFDEDHNIRKHLTQVVQWSRPGASIPPEISLRQDTKNTLCDGTPTSACVQGYLDDLDDVEDISDTPRLKRMKRAVLDKFDKCITIDSEEFYKKIRRNGCYDSFYEEADLENQGKLNHDVKTKIVTIDDIRNVFNKEFDKRFRMYIITKITPQRPKRKREHISSEGTDSLDSKKCGSKLNPSSNIRYDLRTNKRSLGYDITQEYRFVKLCNVRTPFRNLIIRQLETITDGSYSFTQSFSRGNSYNRSEASAIFMVLLKLATEGKLLLKQKAGDIMVIKKSA